MSDFTSLAKIACRKSSVGRLDVALDAAPINHWTVASMKDDWKQIFAFQNVR